MIVAKNERNQINEVVQQRKLHSSDACELSSHINPQLEYVWINLQEVSSDHRHRGLPPIVRDLKRRLHNTGQSMNKRNGNPKTDISKEFLQLFHQKVMIDCAEFKDNLTSLPQYTASLWLT